MSHADAGYARTKRAKVLVETVRYVDITAPDGLDGLKSYEVYLGEQKLGQVGQQMETVPKKIGRLVYSSRRMKRWQWELRMVPSHRFYYVTRKKATVDLIEHLLGDGTLT